MLIDLFNFSFNCKITILNFLLQYLLFLLCLLKYLSRLNRLELHSLYFFIQTFFWGFQTGNWVIAWSYLGLEILFKSLEATYLFFSITKLFKRTLLSKLPLHFAFISLELKLIYRLVVFFYFCPLLLQTLNKFIILLLQSLSLKPDWIIPLLRTIFRVT